MGIVSLFAGVGGMDVGLRHHNPDLSMLLACDINKDSQKVLQSQFPSVPIHDDVKTLSELPKGTTVVTAGSPCTDLSSLGMCKGIHGPASSLVNEVFRLVEGCDTVETVVLENVANIFRLNDSEGVRHVVDNFDRLGFDWAYRVLNSASFGLPQNRRRFLIVATRGSRPPPTWFLTQREWYQNRRHKVTEEEFEEKGWAGFYVTEGRNGCAFRAGTVPTLKCNGNGLKHTNGFNPHAILLHRPREKDGKRVLKLHPDDAERAQGLPVGWTEAAGIQTRRLARLGNACPVAFTEFVGMGLAGLLDGVPLPDPDPRLGKEKKNLPHCCLSVKGKRSFYDVSEAAHEKVLSLLKCETGADTSRLLRSEECNPVSERSILGFLRRAEGGRSAMPEWALDILKKESGQ